MKITISYIADLNSDVIEFVGEITQISPQRVQYLLQNLPVTLQVTVPVTAAYLHTKFKQMNCQVHTDADQLHTPQPQTQRKAATVNDDKKAPSVGKAFRNGFFVSIGWLLLRAGGDSIADIAILAIGWSVGSMIRKVDVKNNLHQQQSVILTAVSLILAVIVSFLIGIANFDNADILTILAIVATLVIAYKRGKAPTATEVRKSEKFKRGTIKRNDQTQQHQDSYTNYHSPLVRPKLQLRRLNEKYVESGYDRMREEEVRKIQMRKEMEQLRRQQNTQKYVKKAQSL